MILSIDNLDKLKRLSPNKRLKYLRTDLLRRPRHYLQKRYGLSTETLKAWENGKVQLTEKNLTRVIGIYHQEGITVTKKWLQTAQGTPPFFMPPIQEPPAEYERIEQDDASLILQEVEYFKNSASNAVTMIISNKEMLPHYAPGDYVGGKFKYGQEINKAVNKDCIIKTKSGQLLFRRLIKNSAKNGFNLSCLNPASDPKSQPILFDVKIESAAPVIWHRKPDIE